MYRIWLWQRFDEQRATYMLSRLACILFSFCLRIALMACEWSNLAWWFSFSFSLPQMVSRCYTISIKIYLAGNERWRKCHFNVSLEGALYLPLRDFVSSSFGYGERGMVRFRHMCDEKWKYLYPSLWIVAEGDVNSEEVLDLEIFNTGKNAMCRIHLKNHFFLLAVNSFIFL